MGVSMEHGKGSDTGEKYAGDLTLVQSNAVGIVENADNLHRRLGNRQIQLIAIGGSIGTGLFVSIGNGLHSTGPIGLIIAFIWYCIMVALVNNCMAEMITLYPVTGGFIRLAGQFVDEAFGFMAGWNFFLYEALVIPFEISAFSIVIQYWSSDVPIWSMVLLCVVLYAALNILAVNFYGEAEFWLSGGKVILILSLFMFTFITMCGGNPKKDAYGFRNWKTPFAGATGLERWEGFLAAIWNVSFSVVGPEYISLIAAEAKHPRVYMKAAYKTVYYRFALFFIGSGIAVGIVLPYNDKTLTSILVGSGAGGGTAAASPYVIAMKNLGVTVFPHIVNFLLCTSIFSAGNTYVFCATRSLYSMSLEGRAPRFLQKCTKNGIPIYCFIIVMCFACLGFLQAGKSGARALGILVNLVTAGAFINYVVMSTTYIFYHRAATAQNLDRRSLPYYGYFQPWCGYISVVFFTCVTFVYGYKTFKPYDAESWFGCYAMTIIAIITFVVWKVIKKTKFIKPLEADLVWERPVIDAYEATTTEPITSFWQEMGELVFIRKRKASRQSSVTA